MVSTRKLREGDVLCKDYGRSAMKYKISLSTYCLDIIDVFSVLGNRKSQFTEQALINFIGSKKGKDTLKLMAEHNRKIEHKAAKGERTRPERKVPTEEVPGKISVDSFLS